MGGAILKKPMAKNTICGEIRKKLLLEPFDIYFVRN